LKIIQVSPRFYPYIGGIETHVFEISKRLAKKHDVHVFTTDPSGELPKEECISGIKIKRFNSFAPNEAFFFSPELYSALKKEHADILHIHSNQSLSSLLAFMGMKKTNIKKFIFTPHYSPHGTTPLRKVIRKIYDKIQNRIFFGADRIICVSDYEIELITKELKIPRKKIVKIPNGIDIKKFKNISKVKREHDFQILSVGRIEKYKRVQWILHAVKGLTKKFPDKDIHLVVVGKGPYKEDLLSLCKDLGLENYITFKENLNYDELLKEFSKCDVFVLPSAFEIFGIVVLEALALNKPIIISRDGALPELFGEYGFVINSIKQLEESLITLINDGNKVKVDFDLKNYTWDSVTSKILKLYKKVLLE
jgi:glycosyltransferase involved in cell wall biosynthesis